MPYKIGKQPARLDTRIPLLRDRVDFSMFPPLPNQVQWHAKLPPGGVPLLGNDQYSNCAEATVCHLLQQVGLYTNTNINPTAAECLAVYSAVTGFDASAPLINGENPTDQGTYFAGPGGLLEYWTKTGITIGGKVHKCGPIAKLRLKDDLELQHAIHVFGFVITGATLTQADVSSPYLWLTKSGPIIGGHATLWTGFENTIHATRYDVLTWNGMWRASGQWANASLDEAYVVLIPEFLDARGISPGGIDQVALQADQEALAA